MKKSHHELTNSRISKREFDISIIRKTKRMLGKLAFFGGGLGVFVINGIRTWGLMPFLFCLMVVLFCLMVWGGLRSNGFLMAVASAAKFPNKAPNSAAFHLRHAGK